MGEEGKGSGETPEPEHPVSGLGSKMGTVLTATEAAEELRGKGKRGWGMGLMYSGWREKGKARSDFLEEAVASANLQEAIEREVVGFPCLA